MKKISILLLSVCLLLLSACQTQHTSSSKDPSEPSFGSSHTTTVTTQHSQEGDGGETSFDGNHTTITTTDVTTTVTTTVTTQSTQNEDEQVPELPANARVYLKQQGAVGDGRVDDAPALKRAVSSLKRGGFIYLEKGTYRLGKNVTVPENITLVFAGGAVLAPDKKVTLKITGFVDADIRQIFAGKGKIEGIIRNAGYPQWFGDAVGETASAVFQAAFDALQEVIVPGSVNKYTVGDLRIEHPLRVTGQGKKQVQLQLRSTSMRLFDIRSSDVCIENFKIEGNKNKDSTIIYFNTNEADLRRITISSIWAKNTGFFLRDGESGGKHTVNDVNLYELRVDGARSIGYYLTDFRTGLYLNNIQVQNLGASFKVENPGMLFCNVQDMYFADVDITGGTGQDCKGNALMFENCSNVTIDRGMIEAANGYNLYMKGCSKFTISHWVSGEWNDTSVRMIDCSDIRCDLMLVIGNNYPGSDFPKDQYSPDAIHLTNCRNVVFNGLNIQRFFGNGMIVEDSQGVVVNTLVGWTNLGNTFEERGSSDYNTVNGLMVGECGGKSVILKGSHSKVLGATLNDGTFKKEIVGPCKK